jgi:hypothetical protein
MDKVHFTWTLRLLLLTIPLLLLVTIFIGGGHGTIKPAICLFPFALVSLPFSDQLSWPVLIVAVLQLPVYGLLIDFAAKYKRTLATVASILTIHIALAIVILTTIGNN